jgi:lipocalin
MCARSRVSVLSLLASSLSCADGFINQPNPCPEVQTVNAADNFTLSLEEYTRATWYVQKQQLVPYQPAEELYCVTATYNLEGAQVPFFDGTVITVYNQGTTSDLQPVNGGAPLCARVADDSNPDQLSVAPCFLPNALAGAYWPIYIETNSAGEYTLVVVSGGQPDVVLSEDPILCTTSEDRTNGSGMWILSREPVADPEAITRAEDAMRARGIGTERLRDVLQGEACQPAYDARFIKPRDCTSPGACSQAAEPDECAYGGSIGSWLLCLVVSNLSPCL